jgi:hypothetical protein
VVCAAARARAACALAATRMRMRRACRVLRLPCTPCAQHEQASQQTRVCVRARWLCMRPCCSVVMPDLRTVYSTDDGSAGVLVMFVADEPKDLTSGAQGSCTQLLRRVHDVRRALLWLSCLQRPVLSCTSCPPPPPPTPKNPPHTHRHPVCRQVHAPSRLTRRL